MTILNISIFPERKNEKFTYKRNHDYFNILVPERRKEIDNEIRKS
jgi:hypothetical protein